MRRHVRLVTRCGCIKEITTPSLKLTMRVQIDRTFIGVDTGNGSTVVEQITVRRFEHLRGTGLGDDVAVYEEVAQP